MRQDRLESHVKQTPPQAYSQRKQKQKRRCVHSRWHLLLKPWRLQDVFLLDCAFFRILFCSLGLFGGRIVQKKGLESMKALGILIFSQQKGVLWQAWLICSLCLPLNTTTVAVSRVLFRLMSQKLILCSINLHKYVCSADQIGPVDLTKAESTATQHFSHSHAIGPVLSLVTVTSGIHWSLLSSST